MFKKLFAAVICGVVIASISTHADAAGPGSMARGFATIERDAIVSLSPLNSADKIDVAQQDTLSALDQYFGSFAETEIEQ